jgi:serine/threonine-protein kinase
VATSRIADSVGRVLGDRYRLTRPLGVGASAHVYVGEDISLRRLVAIKVLHPVLAGDQAFLRRFRAEAQVVAGLRHPNILRVYDWGQDDGSAYLVMELLEGGSLRAVLDRGHLLSPAQAAAMGADVARALDYAHRRGLVHRDIKPANLIFDDEGRITVADFGLARALAEATWTEPAGAVVGTARYAAPEQVRGESLDSRADVYALSLVLIEATTGVVPFAADTTLATLMARVDRPIQAPGDIGPLGAVLEAAGTVDPADRLDALALARALDEVAARLPPPAPLPLAGPGANGPVERDTSPTDYPGRPRLFDGASVDERDEGLPTAPGHPDLEPAPGADPSSGRPGPPPGGAPAGVPETAAEIARAEVAPTSRDRVPRRRARRVAVIVVAALLLAGAVVGGLFAAGVWTPSHPVPNLIGSTQASAEQRLRPLHLHLRVTGSVYDSRAEAGTVIRQAPAGGRLKEGGSVAVTLSRGPQPVAVPDVQGLTVADATALLHRIGLQATVSRQSSLTTPAGTVISSTPKQGTLLPGQAVALIVSSGQPVVPVPALSGPSGASFPAARAALNAVGLSAVEQDQYSDNVARGGVIGTTPPGGTPVTVGSPVTVLVSRGPHLVAVPNVAGESVGAASQALVADGFQVSGVTGNPIATVTATAPAGGTLAHFGAAVQIVTS